MWNETQQYTHRRPGQSAKSATSYSNKMGQVHCNQPWVNLSVLTFAVLCMACKLFMNENAAAATWPLLSNRSGSVSINDFCLESNSVCARGLKCFKNMNHKRIKRIRREYESLKNVQKIWKFILFSTKRLLFVFHRILNLQCLYCSRIIWNESLRRHRSSDIKEQ